MNPPPPPQPPNTAVYVTGLPPDATVKEIEETFTRKAGIIGEDPKTGEPRIKLYKDEEGNLKGDALIIFFKPQSVDLAITLLDDTPLRPDAPAGEQYTIQVQASELKYKKSVQKQKADGGNQTASAPAQGEGQGDRKHKIQDPDRQRILRKKQKLNAKLADWDDDDPAALPTRTPSKWDKVVVFRHMFTQKELDEDPAALLEIKEDIHEECSDIGQVTNVVLWDLEPEGVVTVKFKDPEDAEKCMQAFHGRNFGGQRIHASLATGSEKFKKSKHDMNKDNEDEDED
jgi:HIV Tat-specific factor 1